MADTVSSKPSPEAAGEASLRRELDHLASIINTSLNAVVGMDEGGRITTWSNQAERTFGRTREAVLGRTVASTIVPPQLRDAHEQGLQRYLRTRVARVLGSVVTVTALGGDGREFPAELAISPPLTGVDGSLEFIAFVRDISDRARGERMRTMQAEVTRALVTSRSLEGAAGAVLEAIATALQWPFASLWLVDAADTRLRQTTAWQAADQHLERVIETGSGLALAPGEGFPGRIWAAEHPLSVDDFGADATLPRAGMVREAGLHAAAGLPITHRGAVIGVIELLGREAVHLDDSTLSVMMDLGYQIGQFVDRVHMSQELVRAHEALRERAAELEETHHELIAKAADLERSNTDLEQFARVASHDLQEPLRMVASYVQLLERRYRGKLGAEADDYIAFAVEGSKRMQALIADLLAYSRSGHEPQAPTTVDSGRCLEAARANLTGAIRESRAEIEHDELPSVRGNATQLTQVFQNLLGNALKFRGDRTPRIRVEAHRENGAWLFSVTDNGIGIDPLQGDRVFQVFQRLHSREQYSGTGIGLALCKKVVERLGGRIWLESKPGVGSTFKFTVPPADNGTSG